MRPGGPGDAHAVDGVGLLGDDVDHSIHGVTAVERGSRPAYDLDPLDTAGIDRQVGAHRRVADDAVVKDVAVEHDQDARVEIRRAPDAAYAERDKRTVVGQVEAGHRLQHLIERGPAVPLDLLGRDHSDR